MIRLTPGYAVPRFSGYGDPVQVQVPAAAVQVLPPGEPMPVSVAAPVTTSPMAPLVRRVVVYGGIPVCAWLAVRHRSILAGSLGVGIAYLYLQGLLTPTPGDWTV
jgi:hypothetical protein